MKSLPDYRLAVQLSGPKKIPYNHQELIQNKIYSEYLFGTMLGEKIHKDKYSLFTYSLLANDPKFTKSGFVSQDGKWIFRFASAYRDLLQILENVFINYPTVELFPKYVFKVRGIYKEPLMERNIFQSQPILEIDRKGEKFITPDNKEFFEAVVEGLYKRHEFFHGVRPRENAIKSIRFTKKPRQKLIAYKQRNLLSFAGPIKIEGDADVIKFAQCIGLGQLPSAGFGMLI